MPQASMSKTNVNIWNRHGHHFSFDILTFGDAGSDPQVPRMATTFIIVAQITNNNGATN